MNALLCQSGNGYKATTSAKDKQKAVRITSCTNASQYPETDVWRSIQRSIRLPLLEVLTAKQEQMMQ